MEMAALGAVAMVVAVSAVAVPAVAMEVATVAA